MSKPTWCETCESWRFYTALSCGRDECPRPIDHPPLYPDESGDWVAANRGAPAMALRRMAAWMVVGPSGQAVLNQAAAELDRLREENRRLVEGIMRCVDAGWRPNAARDWTRPELILAEYISDLREGN
jgi:hypothetical protein